MQPRFRSILWKEMPPFVRRTYVGWSRFLLHFELSLGQLYLSWTRSPTWNFVGIVGTLGILLTILLFLAPTESPSESRAKAKRSAQAFLDQERRPWELDATLPVASISKSNNYPVELASDPRSRAVSHVSELATDDLPPRRRRHSPVVEETSVPEIDWFDDGPQQSAVVVDDPPQLGLEIEIVGPSRRRTREPEVADVSCTARSEPVHSRNLRNHDTEFDPDDPWRPFDPSQVADREESSPDGLTDHQAIAVSMDGDDAGSLWEPMPMPGSAASAVEIDLELSWDRSIRTSPPRRQRSPALHIRNLGPEAIPRIDVLRGELLETDFTVSQRLAAQVLPELPPGQEFSVTRMTAPGRSHSRSDVVSILVTAFVGNRTTAIEAVVQNEPPPREQVPSPIRPVNRPHLRLSTGHATRLQSHKMLSVPMRVVNDGGVNLDGVVIVAEIPPTLEHRYGRTVHFRIGYLRPNEERQTLLLLKPLEAGSTSVKLHVADLAQTAMDDGVVDLDITAADVAAPPESPSASRPTSVEDARPRSKSRGRTTSSRTPGF